MREASTHLCFRPTTLLLTAAVACAAGLAPARAGEEPLVPASRKPRVEVVFALDTTGSMSGLIDGAKRKIWSIVNEIQKAEQKPEVRLGVVAYRDRGDAYVTQTIPLSDDIDAVYAQLMRLSADGGGDEPEDVNAALHEAVNNMAWSDGKGVLKLVFLVGDAEPHMD